MKEQSSFVTFLLSLPTWRQVMLWLEANSWQCLAAENISIWDQRQPSSRSRPWIISVVCPEGVVAWCSADVWMNQLKPRRGLLLDSGFKLNIDSFFTFGRAGLNVSDDRADLTWYSFAWRWDVLAETKLGLHGNSVLGVRSYGVDQAQTGC